MGNVTFLGVEGAGKTVLTMALLKCFKKHEAEGWFLRPETNNAFRFLNQLPDELDQGTLPHQTVALRHLALNVLKDHAPQRTFDILDYPGEIFRLAFLDAKDDPDPFAFSERVEAHRDDIEALLGHLTDSDQVFVLFNLDDGRDLATNTRNSDAVWATNACLDYLHRLPSHPKITLLLTQIDRHVDLETYDFNPGAYVAHYLPLIAQNFPHLDILAVAALGPTDATYGLDSILLRCLYDTPYVQNCIHTLDTAHDTISQCASQFFTEEWQQTACERIKYAIADYNTACSLVDDIWFMRPDSLIKCGISFSPDTTSDLAVLLSIANRAMQCSAYPKEQRQALLEDLRRKLSQEPMRSTEGREWRRIGMGALLAQIEALKRSGFWNWFSVIAICLTMGIGSAIHLASPSDKVHPIHARIPLKALSPFEQLQRNAESGNVQAQYELARCYTEGKGVSEDMVKAATWYRKAAEKGHAKAQFYLGVCYFDGLGVKWNNTTAVEWFRKAAEQGDAMAQFNLGVCYEKGRGVEKDETMAVEWYRKAAEQGDVRGQFNLGICYGYGRGVEKNTRETVKWFRKAANQGDSEAQFNVGVCYYKGEGVEKDKAMAVEWFRKAANQDDARAQFILGVCYDDGEGVEKNETMAVEWYRKAAEQGYVEAFFALGNCYRYGKGVEKDFEEAMKWYRRAEEQGHEEAAEILFQQGELSR